MRIRPLVYASLLLAFALSVSRAHATVLRVVVVETPDVAAYTKEVERGAGILKRTGSSVIIRVWRARFAGDAAGTVVVSLEYADLATLANDDKKAMADAEYTKWFEGLQKMRKIVSDSIYDELTSR